MKLLVTLAFVVMLFANGAVQEKTVSRAGWKTFTACGAKFDLPSDFREEKTQGIDSCVRQYRGKSTLVILDVLGYFSPNASRRDEYSGKRDFHFEQTQIDGRRAEVITCYEAELPEEARGLNYAAVLFVPQMRKDGGNLTIWTYGRSPEAREKAVGIIQSVRFPKE